MSYRLPEVFIFTALQCEAKPLIARYKLKKLQSSHPFNLYQRERMLLVISGVGKVAMAASVAYTLALFPVSDPVMVNIGVAGHADKSRGSLLIADKLNDKEAEGKYFYPHWLGASAVGRSALVTASRAETNYADATMHDMEGAGFYEVAMRFSCTELVHCLKIISDNALHTADLVNAKLVSHLIADQLESIDDIISQLTSLRSDIVSTPNDELLQCLCRQFHFSVSNQLKLKVLLQRWDVVTNGSVLNYKPAEYTDGKQFIRWLELQIEAFPYYL